MKRIASVLVALALTGCEAPEPRARTAAELAKDPAVLQGVLARCEAEKRSFAVAPECANARLAMERIGQEEDAKRNAEREAQFQRQRAQRREAQDDATKKAEAAANAAFDPYTAPVGTESPSTTPKQ